MIAAEQVAAELVAAEQIVEAARHGSRRLHAAEEVLAVRIVGRDQRRENGRQNEEGDEDDGHPSHDRTARLARRVAAGPMRLRTSSRGSHRGECADRRRCREDRRARLRATVTNAPSRTTPCTTRKSRARIDCTVTCPRPGQAKTVSTMTAPASRLEISSAATVITGMEALRARCRQKQPSGAARRGSGPCGHSPWRVRPAARCG